VETGHIKEVGGTLEISIIVDENEWDNKIEEIVDYLDHTTIIPKENEELKKYTKRFFLVNEKYEKYNFIKDIFVILAKFLEYLNITDYKIKIKYGKYTYIQDKRGIQNILNFVEEFSEELFTS
jgi:hypothetical protein